MSDESTKLNKETQVRMLESFTEHAKYMQEKVAELDVRLSRNNLLTNGAAAIALLAFISTGNAPPYSAVPLIIFVVGVIASGIEVRSQMNYFGVVHKRILAQKSTVRSNEFDFEDFRKQYPKELFYKYAEHVLGWISQLSFMAGVAISAWIFWKYFNTASSL